MQGSKQHHMEYLSLYLGHVNKRNKYNHMQWQRFSVNEFIRNDITDADANTLLGVNGS